MSACKNTILVPVSFSEHSHVLLEQTFNLARLNNASITLLYVMPGNTSAFYIPFFSRVQSKLMIEKYHNECLNILNDIIKKVAHKTDVPIKPMVEQGKVYAKIIEVSEKIKAKYIVMGVEEYDPKRKRSKVIGSNTLRVLKETKRPVVTIQGKNFTDGCRTILLPLDPTKEIKIKVRRAIELAHFYNAEVKIFTSILSADQRIVGHIKIRIENARRKIMDNQIVCTAEVRLGIKGKDTLGQMILKYAHEVNADLIMIMTQQEMDWVESFVGSTAQEIVIKSSIPVLSLSPICAGAKSKKSK